MLRVITDFKILPVILILQMPASMLQHWYNLSKILEEIHHYYIQKKNWQNGWPVQTRDIKAMTIIKKFYVRMFPSRSSMQVLPAVLNVQHTSSLLVILAKTR